MKRVTINPVTNIVVNVEAIDAGSSVSIDVANSVRVGPGMIWNQNVSAPSFEDPQPEPIIDPEPVPEG